MKNVTIIGNPNTGKSTLFNAITKSDLHTGNWHGVTVDVSNKVVQFGGEKYTFTDLPGFYSMTAYSFEEQVSIDYVHSHKDDHYIYVLDANSLRRNLYLAVQLLATGINMVIYINNYDIFTKHGGQIDINALSAILGTRVVIGNALKQRFDPKLIAENNDFKVPTLATSEQIYKFISNIYAKCVKIDKNYTYGVSRWDKVLLNKWLFLPLFLLSSFLIMYLTFFSVGGFLSDEFVALFELVVEKPISYLLSLITHSQWLLDLFNDGIFDAFNSVLSFIVPVCLLYIFIGLIEDSGIMARMAFMLDDSLSKIGLNGKSAYTLLLGFGCNTTAVVTAQGMANKNAKIKTALMTPYMTCTAKLPIYSVIAGALFGAKSIFVIFGLYLLGITVSIMVAGVLEKTILPTHDDSFLLEFPAIRRPSIKKVTKNALKSAKTFLSKVVTIVVGVSVIVWVLNNFNFRFSYLPNNDTNILPTIAKFIAPVFSPLGFASVGAVTALIVGILAKELVLSSLVLTGALGTLTGANGVAFLVFVALYAPCISTIAVLKGFVGKKWTAFSVISQIIIAYTLSRLIFVLLTGKLAIIDLILSLFVIVFVVLALVRTKKTRFCAYSSTCTNRICKKCQK